MTNRRNPGPAGHKASIALCLLGLLASGSIAQEITVGQAVDDSKRDEVVAAAEKAMDDAAAAGTGDVARRGAVDQSPQIQVLCDIYNAARVPLGREFPSFTFFSLQTSGPFSLPKDKRCHPVCDDYCSTYPGGGCAGYMINVCRQPCCGDGVAALCTSQQCDLTYNSDAPRRCMGFCSPGFNGDPHFRPLTGSIGSFEFMGAGGMVFSIVTEPNSVLNAEFSTLGMSDATFVKAVGFADALGHTLTIDSNTTDCIAEHDEADTKRRPLVVTFNGTALDLAALNIHDNMTNTVTTLVDTKDLLVKYVRTASTGHGRWAYDESVEFKTPSISYTVTRPAGACHLNLGLYLVDSTFVRAPAAMHGLLGQTLNWANLPVDQQKIVGDEGDYMVAHLLDTTSFAYNTFKTVMPAVHRRALVESGNFKPVKGGLVHDVGCGAVPVLRSL